MIAWGMFGFLIKKTFFDMWDHLIRIVILNLGFFIPGAGLVYAADLWLAGGFLQACVLALPSMALLSVYSGVVSSMTSMIADYTKPEFAEFLPILKATYPTSLLFALANAVLLVLFPTGFRVYGGMKVFVGFIAYGFLVWVFIFWILAFQYFFPVQARLHKKFRKIVRVMFLLLLDNPLFTVGLLIVSFFTFIISVFTAFLLPGITSIFLLWNAALKLRLYKYDYLEENPAENPGDRRKIPWDALLALDRDRVGKRTLKGMIFPWKE